MKTQHTQKTFFFLKVVFKNVFSTEGFNKYITIASRSVLKVMYNIDKVITLLKH